MACLGPGGCGDDGAYKRTPTARRALSLGGPGVRRRIQRTVAGATSGADGSGIQGPRPPAEWTHDAAAEEGKGVPTRSGRRPRAASSEGVAAPRRWTRGQRGGSLGALSSGEMSSDHLGGRTVTPCSFLAPKPPWEMASLTSRTEELKNQLPGDPYERLPFRRGKQTVLFGFVALKTGRDYLSQGSGPYWVPHTPGALVDSEFSQDPRLCDSRD